MWTLLATAIVMMQPPEKSAATLEIPPTFGMISNSKEKDAWELTVIEYVTVTEPRTVTETQNITKTKVVDGKEVPYVEQVTVMKTVNVTVNKPVPTTKIISSKTHKLVDMKGREAPSSPYQSLMVLIAPSAAGLPEAYKPMFASSTLILVPKIDAKKP